MATAAARSANCHSVAISTLNAAAANCLFCAANCLCQQRPSHHLVSTLVSTRYSLHTTWYQRGMVPAPFTPPGINAGINAV